MCVRASVTFWVEDGLLVTIDQACVLLGAKCKMRLRERLALEKKIYTTRYIQVTLTCQPFRIPESQPIVDPRYCGYAACAEPTLPRAGTLLDTKLLRYRTLN